MKIFGTEFLKFYCRGRFYKKTQKNHKISILAISGRHNYATITDRRKITTK